MSPLVNRREVLVKLKSPSVLKNPKFEDFQLLPIFKHGEFPLIPTGEIVFQPKEGVDYDSINTLYKDNIVLKKESKYGTFTVISNDLSQVVTLANRIYESGLVEWCEPNFIVEIVKHQQTPTDPLYSQQYYLNQTNNIDINAPQAWQLSTGINEVRVAVIDDGVEAHEDLNGRVLQGFTPTDPNGFGGPTNNLPPVNEGIIGHGQACAGIIGATHDNMGVAGIAPCTHIVPVNIFNAWFLDLNFPVGQRLRWVEDAQDIAEAINWAWDDGEADVLNNSWGYGTTNANNIPQSGQIIQAIQNARTQGRNGFGSVVVFSSGNFHQNFSGVSFPANVNGVITVGAINRDGNIWNYSSRGQEMDLVAPSGNLGGTGDIVTTDRQGALGYDPGNYTDGFGGTSAAAPQVAGVAALMLSVNPNLTEAQVRTILQQTATDMGSSGFDNTFGFGRLNAQTAVQAALPSINGPSLVCTGGAQFTLNDIPPGTQATWSATPSRLFAVSSGTGTTPTLSPANSHTIGQGTLTFTITSDCGQMQVQSSPFWVGVPPIGDITPIYGSEDGTTICANQNLQFTHSSSYPFPQDLQYTWNVTNGTLLQDAGTYATIRTPPAGQSLEIQLVLTNACGSAYEHRSFVTAFVVDGQYCFEDQAMFSIYPNPADNFLTVEVRDERLFDKDDFQLQIFDLFGNSVYNQKLVDQTTIIDRNQLESGIYQIFIYNKTGEAVEQKRVLIR